MQPDLAGKTALITGGAKRIGAACALALAGAGADIVLHYHHSSEDAEKTADSIRSRGIRAWPLRADLESEKETRGLFGKGPGYDRGSRYPGQFRVDFPRQHRGQLYLGGTRTEPQGKHLGSPAPLPALCSPGALFPSLRTRRRPQSWETSSISLIPGLPTTTASTRPTP